MVRLATQVVNKAMGVRRVSGMEDPWWCSLLGPRETPQGGGMGAALQGRGALVVRLTNPTRRLLGSNGWAGS